MRPAALLLSGFNQGEIDAHEEAFCVGKLDSRMTVRGDGEELGAVEELAALAADVVADEEQVLMERGAGTSAPVSAPSMS
jgi:hypothetical protein